MKYVKTLGLLAVAATTLLAFASAAPATTITAPSGTIYTDLVVAKAEGPTTLDGVLDVTCNESIVSAIGEAHGTGITAKANIGTLDFTECNGDTVVVQAGGSLEIHATGNGNATLISSGAEITMVADTIFGDIHCIFTTSSTHIGTITAAASSESHATLDIDSPEIPRTGGSGGGLCGASGEMTGSYEFTTPTGLVIDA